MSDCANATPSLTVWLLPADASPKLALREKLMTGLTTRRLIAGVLSFFLGHLFATLGLSIVSRGWAVIDLGSLINPNLHRRVAVVARDSLALAFALEFVF
jgi:hypothetical protein